MIIPTVCANGKVFANPCTTYNETNHCATCQQLSDGECEVPQNCNEQCVCPYGLIEDRDGNCINPANCICNHPHNKQMSYSGGSIFDDDDDKCMEW